MDAQVDRATSTLYAKLEERVMARDQIGASKVYYDLVRAGRPLKEIVAEGVRIHAPYTHVPYHERIDDGYPNFVNNDHCLLSARATVNSDEDGAGGAGDAANGADHLVHPERAGYLEPEDRQGAGALHARPRQSRRDRQAAGAGGVLAGPGAVAPGRTAEGAARQLDDPGASRPGARCLPHFPGPDGGRAEPQGGAGRAGVRRADRRAGPDAVQPLLHDRAQGVSCALDGGDRQRDRLGRSGGAPRAVCRRAGYRRGAALVLDLRDGLQSREDEHRGRDAARGALRRRRRRRGCAAAQQQGATQPGRVGGADPGDHPRPRTRQPARHNQAAEGGEGPAAHPRRDADRLRAGGDGDHRAEQLLHAAPLLRGTATRWLGSTTTSTTRVGCG